MKQTPAETVSDFGSSIGIWQERIVVGQSTYGTTKVYDYQKCLKYDNDFTTIG